MLRICQQILHIFFLFKIFCPNFTIILAPPLVDIGILPLCPQICNKSWHHDNRICDGHWHTVTCPLKICQTTGCPRKNFLLGFLGTSLLAWFLLLLFTHRKVFIFKIKVSILCLSYIQKSVCILGVARDIKQTRKKPKT